MARVLTAQDRTTDLSFALLKRLGLAAPGGVHQTELMAFHDAYSKWATAHGDWVVRVADPPVARAFWESYFAAARGWDPSARAPAPLLPASSATELVFELVFVTTAIDAANHDQTEENRLRRRLGLASGNGPLDPAKAMNLGTAFMAWTQTHSEWEISHAPLEAARKFLDAHKHDRLLVWTAP